MSGIFYKTVIILILIYSVFLNYELKDKEDIITRKNIEIDRLIDICLPGQQ